MLKDLEKDKEKLSFERCCATADLPIETHGGFPVSQESALHHHLMSIKCVDPFIRVHRSGPFERMHAKTCYEACGDIEMHFSIVLRPEN